MKPSEDLFKLIKSLTKSEKTYFRKYASRHVIGGKNNYLKIFDAVAAEKTYDENKLIEGFRKEKFSGHFHVTKNYLFNMILEAVANMKKGDFIDHKLYEDLKKITILMDKGLHKPAIRILENTKTEVSRHKREYLMFRLLDLEVGLSLYSDINKKTETLLYDVIDSKRYYSRYLHIMSELKNLFDMQNFLMKKFSYIRTEDEESVFRKILDDPYMQIENSRLPLEGIFYKYVIRIKYFVAKSDFDNYKIVAEELLQEFDKKPEETADQFSMYVSVALQYLDYCISNRKIPAFEKRLREYQKVLDRVKPDKIGKRFWAEHQATFNGIMVKYYDKIDNNEGFIIAVNKLDIILNEVKQYMPPRRLLMTAMITGEMVFFKKLYEEALYWTNKIINFPAHPAKEDFYQPATVMAVMIHYELGNLQLMDYTIANAEKHFRKSGRPLETERTMLGFFKKAGGIIDKTDLIEELELLKNKIEILANKDTEKVFFTRMRVLEWIGNKLEELAK